MLIYEQRSSEQQTLKNPPFYCNRGRKIQKMDFPVSGSFLLLFGEWDAHQGNIVLRKVCSHVSHFFMRGILDLSVVTVMIVLNKQHAFDRMNEFVCRYRCMWMKLFIPWKRKQHWFWRSGKFSLVCFFYFSVQFACMYMWIANKKKWANLFLWCIQAQMKKKTKRKQKQQSRLHCK